MTSTLWLSHVCPLDISACGKCFPRFLCITCVRAWNAITPKTLWFLHPVPPSFLFSPRCHFCLFFSCLSKRKQFGGLSWCGANSWHFSQPCQGSNTVPVVMQQNTAEMSRRQGQSDRYLSRRSLRPHAFLPALEFTSQTCLRFDISRRSYTLRACFPPYILKTHHECLTWVFGCEVSWVREEVLCVTTSTRGMAAVLFGLCLCAVVGFDSGLFVVRVPYGHSVQLTSSEINYILPKWDI